MDANGQRFWTLSEARHFAALSHAAWDSACHVLRLASERTLQSPLAPAAARTAALAALDRIPRAVDGLECVARWDSPSSAVVVHSHMPNDAIVLPLAATPTDLCAGADGVLYAALPTGVHLHDLRGRWAGMEVTLAGFQPWRLAPAADGSVWALERTSGRLARLTGRPRRTQTPQPDDYDPRVFRPSPENGDAPLLTLVDTPSWPAGEEARALAAAPDGAVALLIWIDADGHAAVRRWLAESSRWSAPIALRGADHAYALAWLALDRIAVRLPGRRDAPAYDLPLHGQEAFPLGLVYPLADDAQEAPFANGAVQPPRYPRGEREAQPLHPLSFNTLARRGEAMHFAGSGSDFSARLLDSGDTTTVWHRLCMEAGIPAHCGVVAWLAATQEPRPPEADDLAAWHAHGFGRDIAQLDDAMQAPQVPRAAWERAASELPGHPGFLSGPREKDTRGLFSVLVQNSRQRVRTLAGRYLWVRLVLHGDGRATPEIAALRAWGSRFSYADQYLPRLYRESLFGDAAQAPGEVLARIDLAHAAALDAGGAPPAALRARLLLEDIRPGPAARVVVERPQALWLLQDGAQSWRLAREDGAIAVCRPQATPADFNARLLGNFEGVLTQLEDRVAAAHLLSHPAVVPEDNLEWLAGWIGVAFDAALPAARRRAWLAAAPDLALRHGTRDGLRLALDVATGGGVRGGEIVVIESFRLRRILATLLGVDLADENDPLLPGLQVSGNSVVGDTLTLGDHEGAELMALFREDAATTAEDNAALRFHERLAHRALVLVHQEVEPQDLALIRRIVRLEAPAHVDVQVAAATWPLLVGVASLVGVDTYLAPPRVPRPVQLQRSVLGVADRLIGPGVLDPRLSGTPATGGGLVLDAPPAPDSPSLWRWWPPA
jgi:phage tail-like protein